jgi:hypothetical protein
VYVIAFKNADEWYFAGETMTELYEQIGEELGSPGQCENCGSFVPVDPNANPDEMEYTSGPGFVLKKDIENKLYMECGCCQRKAELHMREESEVVF